MKLLISGICGFVGSTLARGLAEAGHEVLGFDSFVRPGSETNRLALQALGIRVFHADVRVASDLQALPKADWVIDAAANPSVLAGVDGQTSSQQLVEHNLGGTIHLLEYCKRFQAGFTLLSTSRVYSIPPLAALPVLEREGAFVLEPGAALPEGVSEEGIAEHFSTAPPVSLYGATKVASETLALEYGATFGFPVWINRCGVLAGAGQFGRADQGIFSFWIHSWARRQPLKYIGFNGSGAQVRDLLHPLDLLPVLAAQFEAANRQMPRISNFSGGRAQSLSLAQLSCWCAARLGERTVERDLAPRPFDLPWMVLDSSQAKRLWNFRPERSTNLILEEIAAHAEANLDWLRLSAG